MTAGSRGSSDRPYVPLWCKSHYSFLEGASSPAELMETAAELGLDTLAVTDRDGIYGIPRAHVAAKEHGVKLIIGSELSLDDGEEQLRPLFSAYFPEV